jgi:hypothetical protein
LSDLSDLSDFVVFGHVLAPCVGVLPLGNPRYIFTPAPTHMCKPTLIYVTNPLKNDFHQT